MAREIIAESVANCPPDCECHAAVSFCYRGEGEEVERGEEFVELDTGDSVVVLEAPVSGRLSRIVVPEGERVPRLKPLGIIQ